MALAVLGGQSLDTLEAWVRELFSHVPSGRGARPTFDGMPRPYKVSPKAHPSSAGRLDPNAVPCANALHVRDTRC